MWWAAGNAGVFFAQVTAEMLIQAGLPPPPSLRLGPPWPLSLPNSRMSASECSERCTPASPAAVGAKEQRRRHDSEADEDG